MYGQNIQTEKQVEYLVFPSTLAMSEVTWSGPSQNFDKDYPHFFSRAEGFMKRLDALDINYANYLYEVEGSILKKDDGVY